MLFGLTKLQCERKIIIDFGTFVRIEKVVSSWADYFFNIKYLLRIYIYNLLAKFKF
jgi:hypothetical protein